MKTTARNQRPNSIRQCPNKPNPRQGGAPVKIGIVLAAVAFLLFGTVQARAQGIPPGCSGSAIGISLFTSAPDVHIGDTLTYSVSVFNGIVGNPTSCDASNITASITTPDGVVHPILLRRTYLRHTESDFYTNVVSYVARAQDIRPDGTLRTTAEDKAVIFQNDTPSNGGANQGVNTEVSQPCIQLIVQCVPSVGQDGAIVFNGTVTNCGNNTLVGVTVTNYVNGGAFPVFFPTNIARGQSVSFTGSYVPANPCVPSTATLVAVATDQFTANPQRVVSTNLTTCSAVITRGIKVTKTCPVDTTAPGQLLTFSGSVSNTGNITVTNVVVVNDQPVPNTPVFARASLAPGEVVTFTASYVAPTNCSVTDTLTATATGSCGVPVSSTATATCALTTAPGITVTEVCPVTPGVSGGSSSYSGVVRNTGNITLNNVSVVSDRPAPNTVVFTVSSLAPGASANYSGTFTIPLDVCTVTTSVRASGNDACTGAGVTNTASATCPITTAPAIAVTLACPAVQSTNGGLITYTGTVRNSGNVTLNNVVVTDAQSSPTTVLTIPSLAPGVSANFSASFTAPTNVCSFSSTVNASASDRCSSVVVSNSASANCALATTPRIVVTQNCSASPVSPGGVLSYSGTVSNAGNIALTNIVVRNDRSGTNVIFTTPILLPGATTNFTGSYTVPAGTDCSVTSIVTVRGNDNCSGSLVTNAASATCSITGTPLVAVTLNCPAGAVVTGNSITFSGTVSNPGNVTLINVTVVNSQATPSTVLTVASLAPGASANFNATFISPANACSVSSSVTARGSNTCAGVVATATTSATCTLLGSPAIVVRQNCPATSVSAGGVLSYSGSVSNAGNITLTNIVVVNNQTAASIITTNSTAIVTMNDAGTITTNITVTVTTNAPAPTSFGTINSVSQAVVDRFGAPNNLNGLTYAPEDHGYGATEFYSMRKDTTGTSYFDTIIASTATTTDRFDASTRNFDALAYAAPDLGYGPVIFYYLSHDNAGVSTFGSITPGGVVGVTADHFVVGNNFDALTFAATDVGYGANLFYYVRRDASGLSTFGTISPGLPGVITDRFTVGTNVDALVFTDLTAPGYGANQFYYLRHDANQVSTFGTIQVTGLTTATVTDRFTVGTNATELTFTPTDVGFGPNLFYFLRGRGLNFTTNILTTYSTNTTTTFTTNMVTTYTTNTPPLITVPSLAPGASASFTGSYTVPGSNVCFVTTIVTATARDICSGNTLTNAITNTCTLATAPAIAVTLNCPAGATAPGGLITYSGTVRNSGNITLNAVTVVNSQATPSIVLTVASLAPGASANFTASFTTPLNACSVSSSVVARGTDACTSAAVTNSASATCPIVTAPGITITENCSTAPVGPGGVLTYSGTVRNSGNITLTNVVVTSSRNGLAPVLTVATLAAGAATNYIGSYTVPADSACSITTVVSVTGGDICSGIVASNTASATCPITGTPRIVVTQTCPLIQVAPGSTLTYSGTVSNSGNVTLTNVVVTNDRNGATVVFSIASLAPRATASFTGSYVTHTDCCVDSSTLTATGRDCNNTLARDTATRTCSLLTGPAIAVTILCPPEMWKPLAPGDVLTYSGIVSNSGNIALTNVTIVNNTPTNGSRVFGPITLAAGESSSYTASFVVPVDFCGTHTVTARGMDSCTQLPVTASATTTCPITTTPRITVTKNCPAQPTPYGGLFVFTGSVSNSGNITLTNVYVVEGHECCAPSNNMPVIGPITLAPGASRNFSGSYLAPTNCCEVTDTVTAYGQDRCAGTLVVDTATQVCPLLTTPRIAIVEHCPTAAVPVGGLYEFTGSVTNTGDVVLTNVFVFANQPGGNTVLSGPFELAPGESEGFYGSFTVVAGSGGLIVTASGLDTCQARVTTAAANCSGPISPPNQPRAITFVINGNGTVSGVANGQLLNIGQNYTVTATPAAGSSFVNWSGGVSSTSPALNFVMRSNLVLTATFVFNGTNGSNVFIPVAGTFNGLFFDTNDVQSSSSGCFTLAMTAAGTYRATIKHNGKNYAVKGAFDLNGHAINTIPRAGKSPLTVNWHGDLSDSDYISGTVSDDDAIARLEGGRDVFNAGNPAPQAGRYTLIIGGVENATDSPAGDGYGTVIVGTDGVVHLKGKLADGSVANQNVALSKNGEWPVCISLYGGKGVLIGWLRFADDGSNDIAGTLRWMKPGMPTSKLYKPGFSVNSSVIGSHYVAPIGTAPMLQITEGLVVLSGGNLPDSTNAVTFGPGSKLVNDGTNALKLTFKPASGLFSGTFREAGTTKTFAIKGAVLQRQNNGSGYAPGTDQSGRVLFQAVP